MIRRFLIPAALVLLVLYAAGCDHDSCSPGGLCFLAEAEYHEEIPVADGAPFYLRGTNGDVSLTAEPGSDRIVIRATKRARSDTRETADLLVDSLQVTTLVHEESVSILVNSPPEGYSGSWEVDLEISHPPDSHYRVDMTNGSLRAAGARAGAILLTRNGDIRVRDGEGPTILETANGSIEADLVVPPPQMADLRSTNGNLSLTVPDTTSAWVVLGTINGSVSIQGLSLSDADITAHRATGCLGTCDAQMRLTTTNGNIVLRGR